MSSGSSSRSGFLTSEFFVSMVSILCVSYLRLIERISEDSFVQVIGIIASFYTLSRTAIKFRNNSR